MTRLKPSWLEQQKFSAELDFWINHWDARLRSGQFWNSDIENLLRPVGEWPIEWNSVSLPYATVRQLEARAHGLRILNEAQIDQSDFFADKIVVDIGPGAICFLETSDARGGIAIEPLAREFAAHGLLLASEHVIYLPVAAEDMPLVDESVDVVVSRNNLDHVTDPATVVHEVYRILKPGGTFILIVHLEPEASITEPHAFTADAIRMIMRLFITDKETISRGGRTEVAYTLAGVYRKPSVTK